MMGGWLTRLKNGNTCTPHATKPTKPLQVAPVMGFVGFVVQPRDQFQKNAVADLVGVRQEAQAVNEGKNLIASSESDLDRWCWPHSTAMNADELETFKARLARFTDKGVSYADAEQLADKLMQRDGEGDDRRSCVECESLSQAGSWQCGNCKKAGLRIVALPKDFVLMLQRCPGFMSRDPKILK